MTTKSPLNQSFWLVAALTALALIPFLGEALFYSKGEPREAIVAYTMLESGNWILPLNYGSDIAFKPPFLYWCISTCATLLGGLSEFTSRLPSALAFLAMQLLFFRFVARRKDVPTALLSSLLLLTSFEVHRAAVACRVDMVQVCFIVCAICLLFRWDEQGCRRVPWVAILLMGCATLTKGPVGSVFPCLVIGVYQLMRGRPFAKAFFSLAGIGLLSLLPYALWIFAAWRQGGDGVIDLMLEENTGRLTGKMSYESHENPIWYNFLTLIWGWVPWTLVLLLSLFDKRVRQSGNRARHTLAERLREAWVRFRQQSPLQLLGWLTILIIFTFYCIPKSKRSVYLLPIYPFMAMLMADYLLALARRGARSLRLGIGIFATLGLLLTAAFVAVRCGLVPDSIFGHGRHAAENVAFLHALRYGAIPWGKWLLVALPALAALFIFRTGQRRHDDPTLPIQAALMALTLFVALDSTYQPLVLSTKSDKALAQTISEMQPEGPVYSYAKASYYSVNYYLGDRMRHIESERPDGEGLLIVSDKEEEAMLQALSADYDLQEVYHSERRSCDMRSPVNLYKFQRR